MRQIHILPAPKRDERKEVEMTKRCSRVLFAGPFPPGDDRTPTHVSCDASGATESKDESVASSLKTGSSTISVDQRSEPQWLGERDRPGRRVVRLAPRFLADGLPVIFIESTAWRAVALADRKGRGVFVGTPNTAVGTTALPGITTEREMGEPRASLRGTGAACFAYFKRLVVHSFFPGKLTQVIDFHDFSGFFSWFSWRPLVVILQFLIIQEQLTQVVDFHDRFG